VTNELPPLVLLHGMGMSGSAWQETVPQLAGSRSVYTPSALGHRGGPAVQERPATLWDVVDAAERYLDEKKLDRPHLVGNSTGGFVALELARRGRAASVCAFSPAGFWSDELRVRAIKRARLGWASMRFMRRITPLLLRAPSVRQYVLRDFTLHGERLSAARAVRIAEEFVECTIVTDIADRADEHIALMDPLPCPITIAWAERDTVFPLGLYEATVRDTLPTATFSVLPGVGHVPMLDDPQLVARTILAAIGTAKA
jgi:pimeloyl-ACP methyl ester carboxylesterase